MSKTFQPPPGTRDFYPDEMAMRRFIEDAWRRASIRHGFVEVDGPTFEYLDLYKVKSGDEIVSQLFHFESRGEDKTQFALRPEFTPTLARMVASKANALPRPIKWFSIPRCYRAERPQKGRLREFFQWNVDMLGGETPEIRRQFDLEIAALCLDSLRDLGLTNSDVALLWNDRSLVENLFCLAGIPETRFSFAFFLLDRLAKLSPEQRKKQYAENDLPEKEQQFFEKIAVGENTLSVTFWEGLADGEAVMNTLANVQAMQAEIDNTLATMGLAGYAKYDASIVRGLAYYTGFVFEVADTQGANRAVAGGGRYDKLIEMFGGPSLPAVGFGMGNVVLEILLNERKRLPATVSAKPDVFVVNALPSPDQAMKLVGELRASTFEPATNQIAHEGLFVGVSYKASKNVGKLMGDAANSGARLAILLAPDELARNVVKVRNLLTREELELPVDSANAEIRRILAGL